VSHGLAKAADIHKPSVKAVQCESSGNSRKALSIKACKPWVNTNTAVLAAQQKWTCWSKCLLNFFRQAAHCSKKPTSPGKFRRLNFERDKPKNINGMNTVQPAFHLAEM
jgi:hypothetical protein